MAKNDLIGGSLWEQYSQKVSDRMNNPKNLGELTEEDAKEKNARLIVADYGAEACGDAVRIFWLVDEDTDTILESKFKSFGCGTAIASCDVMCDMCVGKSVDEALKITNLDVEHALRDLDEVPAVPAQKMHCSVMAYDVIKRAVGIYKNIDVATLEKDDIVCECGRVSLGTIKEVIKLNDLKTVEDITRYTKAGAFCKSCIKPGGHEERKYYLVDILEETRAEMEAENRHREIPVRAFSEMNLIQKHKAVEDVLTEKIRPLLQADGGNMEVADMKADETRTTVYISYYGTCAGCASSRSGTLYAIEYALREALDEHIDVVIV